MMKRTQGFTLLELTFVIVVLVLFAQVTLPVMFSGSLGKTGEVSVSPRLISAVPVDTTSSTISVGDLEFSVEGKSGSPKIAIGLKGQNGRFVLDCSAKKAVCGYELVVADKVNKASARSGRSSSSTARGTSASRKP